MNHAFAVEMAVKHGLHAAILHETIRFWVVKNKANGRHLHDGRHWTYNSAKAFSELFPYMSPDQIQRALKRLEEAGEIVTGCYNASPYDRTRWYSCAEGVPQQCGSDSAALRSDSANLRNEIPQQCGTNTSSYQVHTSVHDNSTPQPPRGSARKRAPDLRPEDVAEQVWADWCALRKSKKAAVTATALEGIRREAKRAGLTMQQALETCCANGWQGLKAEWLTGKNGQPMNEAQRIAQRDEKIARLKERLSDIED